ncbi:CBP80/20-dependent translation initiation factor isoform X1 [Xiphophorus couchianus]|uniref:CBP80/20-dependent translation initiation factor isoform X1 n=1 Tax=Xiphophorus couchianus TaxID=32473 RepID=UPI001016CDDB|nr:CBP80/20-dependent translation initiation factor isoform X1 [Xiphophorus couchianus]XP_027881508.1 CBP80/20-dependent translation initiation factor isoform X1 [Xiphophorus couchianus]
MENSSVASASSEAGSTRSQEIEELERFIDSYVLEYQVQGILGDKPDGDVDLDNDGKEPQWTDDCINQRDGSWASSQGRGSSKRDEWEHSSNGSTGSRPSSGSRSGSRGRNNQLKGSPNNGNRDVSFDILGTDIWAANTMDSHGGAGWDVQPEKLDFSHFHRKPFRGMPKQLPHIDREGMNKNKFAEDDGIDMNDLERFLPHLHSVFPPLPNEAEIAHTKKLFRRRRNDRRTFDHFTREQLTILLPTGPGEKRRVSARRQQRPQSGGGGGGKNQPQQIQQQSPQQHWDQTHQQPPNQQELNLTDQGDNRNHNAGRPPRQHQGGHVGPRQGGPPHHGYSHNRRWHHNQRGQGHEQTHAAGDKEASPKTTKDKQTEIVRVSDEHIRPPQSCNHRNPNESPNSAPTPSATAHPDPTVNKESLSMLPSRKVSDGHAEQPRVSLLQSSKERLRRRLKDKDEVNVEESQLGPQNMDRLVDLLNSMRSNSSGVEKQLASFMEEAQSSAQSEESLAQVVGAIYSKAVSDRSFAATAAKLCDKMALFMVEGTKFRSLLLNALQRDFSRREELQQTDVERWLGFNTFLCEVFCTMRSSSGQPFRALVCPIYTCLRELLESTDVKEDAVLCCSLELQSTGRLLEEQLPEMMTELLAAVRDKMLCPTESQLTRSLLMEVIELHAHRWSPLEAITTQYYNRTIQKLTTTA